MHTETRRMLHNLKLAVGHLTDQLKEIEGGNDYARSHGVAYSAERIRHYLAEIEKKYPKVAENKVA